MKIGILTFWWSEDNYGQLMQCYALQKYLRNMGHEVFLIRFRDVYKPQTPFYKRVMKAFNPIKLYNFIRNRIRNRRVLAEQKNHNRSFDTFRAKYISMSEHFYGSFAELKNNPPEADIYIVGSDQVWNPQCVGYNTIESLHAYFLDFGSKNTKRMSYAASFGQTSLSPEIQETITPLLQKFHYVSVREESGVRICKTCGCDIAEWVPDPTMLLSAEDYRKLYEDSNIQKPSKKYLLLYMLGNECDFDIKNVYDFAQRKGIEVVYVTGNLVLDRYPKQFATIPEWLCLLDNAEYVITNSFHCGVFATLFHKQFGIVALAGSFAGMNARIESLFELRGTGKRYVTNDDFSVLDMDYEVKDIQVSERFLKELH